MRITPGAQPSSAGLALPMVTRSFVPAPIDASTARSWEAEAAVLAAKVHLPASQLRSFLEDGGELSLSFDDAGRIGPSTAASQGLPLAPDGTPDFDAIEAAGGVVKGALPGGLAKLTISGLGPGPIVMYAASVDSGDGSGPHYVKGFDASSDGTGDPAELLDVIAGLIEYMKTLPDNLVEFEAALRAGQAAKGLVVDRLM